MLAKIVETGGEDWDERLPYTLFAYLASLQESTQDLPFYLLYRCDPQLPSDEMLNIPKERHYVDIDDYVEEITSRMSDAWERARVQVNKA